MSNRRCLLKRLLLKLLQTLGLKPPRTLPNIPVEFTGRFPGDFVNLIPGWGCPPDPQGLYMLDMDFGRVCKNRCPGCFTKCAEYAGDPTKDATLEQHIALIEEAIPLGLREVKVLGKGEPFDEQSFIPFLEYLDGKGITTCVFTKTSVFANDILCSSIHGCTSRELAEKIAKLNVTVMVGFNAIDWEVQERLVVSPGGNYAEIRNRTLELLAEVGLNKYNPSRLGLGSSPMTVGNAADMVELYRWARIRNLHTVICPTMCVGYCKEEAVWKAMTPSYDEQVEIYTEINRINIEEYGIATLEEIEALGIAAYAGQARCTQFGCGLYVRLDGTVTSCPGFDHVIGNTREQTLLEIWSNSVNKKQFAGCKNCGCPAKTGKSMFEHLDREVRANLRRILNPA